MLSFLQNKIKCISLYIGNIVNPLDLFCLGKSVHIGSARVDPGFERSYARYKACYL